MYTLFAAIVPVFIIILIHMHFSGSFIKDQTTGGTFFLTFAAAFT